MERLELDAFLSQEYLCYVKCKQPRPGFEIAWPYPSPTIETILSSSIINNIH